MKNNENSIYLKESDIPQRWLNYIPILPQPLPEVRNTEGMHQIENINKIRPKTLVEQNNSSDLWIDIPPEVVERLIQVGRPTPLRRAVFLEKYLDTPAKIYFKREDTLTTGSFKVNSAIPQLYYCNKEGIEQVITETGAGQWGMAVTLASKFFSIKPNIFMAQCSLKQKPYRKYFMEILGAKLYSSPSEKTQIGKKILFQNPNHPGSIGTAISDAIEVAINNPEMAYLSGSNVTHVLIHQSIIGLELKRQMEILGESPDELIACVSGGGNLGGLLFPFLQQKLEHNNLKFIGAESTAAPRLTQGKYAYDQSDLAGYTPLIKSYTMGQDFIPDPVHIGGLRQHNGSSTIGLLRHLNLLDAEVYSETEAFVAAKTFLETEGILIAPESAHAVASVIKSAIIAKKKNMKKKIVFVLSGNGFLDLEGFNEVLLKNENDIDKLK